MTYLCTHCLSEGNPKSHTKGSFLIELALWIMFIIPGVIYSLWRLTTRKQVCPVCLSPAMIPASSTRAIMLKKGALQ